MIILGLYLEIEDPFVRSRVILLCICSLVRWSVDQLCSTIYLRNALTYSQATCFMFTLRKIKRSIRFKVNRSKVTEDYNMKL